MVSSWYPQFMLWRHYCPSHTEEPTTPSVRRLHQGSAYKSYNMGVLKRPARVCVIHPFGIRVRAYSSSARNDSPRNKQEKDITGRQQRAVNLSAEYIPRYFVPGILPVLCSRGFSTVRLTADNISVDRGCALSRRGTLRRKYTAELIYIT